MNADKQSHQTVISHRTALTASDTFCGMKCLYTQALVALHMECEYTDVDMGGPWDTAEL